MGGTGFERNHVKPCNSNHLQISSNSSDAKSDARMEALPPRVQTIFGLIQELTEEERGLLKKNLKV
jgi:hypothetical protein